MRALSSLLIAVVAVSAQVSNLVFEQGVPASNGTTLITSTLVNPFHVTARAEGILTRQSSCDLECGIYCCDSSTQTCARDLGSGVAMGCCDQGKSLCGSTLCYDPQSLQCCNNQQDGDGGSLCQSGYSCCGDYCCPSGTTCADAVQGTCATTTTGGTSDAASVSMGRKKRSLVVGAVVVGMGGALLVMVV
ncbi:hypothetical protein F4778DRAFT_779724 [Xylariomycetidae sp. FL2044]|nr:hypothetical protein F4778DRAFT_779724 [Xylariomycetidae sp. FL2044]